ncbi:cmgc ck2 protein kinase, partial [Nannochloropsis oceanica]
MATMAMISTRWWMSCYDIRVSKKEEKEEGEKDQEDEEGREDEDEDEDEEAETEARKIMEGVRKEESECVRVRERLGSGKFSEVFLARLVRSSSRAPARGGGEGSFVDAGEERGGGGGGGGGEEEEEEEDKEEKEEDADDDDDVVVLKVLRPVPLWRVEREVKREGGREG